MTRSALAEVALYAAAAVLAFAALFAVYDLTDLRTPIALYSWGDGVYYGAQVKILLETGWVYRHPDLSAPFGLDLYDFAHFDAIHLLILKLIGYVVPDWAVVLNVYYLLTFPLSAVTSLALFRHLGSSRLVSLALCLVFALQPYHFDRGQGHLMLAAYWHIPAMAMGVFWLLRRDGLSDAEGVPAWRSWRGRLACLFAFGGVLAGHYYAFFSCLFYLAAGGYAAFHFGRRAPLVQAAVLVGAVGCGFGLNLAPNALFWASEGSNRTVSAKGPALVEQCALRMTPMLLPGRHHRLAPMRSLRAAYEKQSPVVSLEPQSSIGVVAGLGLMGLCLGGLFGPRRGDGLLAGLGVVALCGLLVATLSGLGCAFAYHVSPQIHGYGRMTPYLALFGLAAVGLAATRWVRSPWLVVGLGVLAVLDVLPAATEPDPKTVRTQFVGSRRFGAEVQEMVPPGTMVYVLPGSTFPLERYDYLDLYLYTEGLRFSAPAMMNRRAAAWQSDAEQLEPGAFLERIALAGFTGLFVDRRARKTPLMDAVEPLLADGPAVRGEGRAFYDLRPYIARLRGKYGEGEWARRQAASRRPVYARTWARFHPPEEGTRWSASKKGFIELVNAEPTPVEIDLTMRVEGGELRVTGGLLGTVEVEGGVVRRRLTVPPGRHTLTVKSAAEVPMVRSGTKPRWFGVHELTMVPVEPGGEEVRR